MAQQLLSIAEAAEWLGLESRNRAQWLRRHLLARERSSGRVIMLRVGRSARRPRYRVAVDNLRAACPELVSKPDQIERELRGVLLAIKRRDEAIGERIDDLEAVVGSLAEAVRKLIEEQRRQPQPVRRAG